MIRRSVAARSPQGLHRVLTKTRPGVAVVMTQQERDARERDYKTIGQSQEAVSQFSRFLKKNGLEYTRANVERFAKLSPDQKEEYSKRRPAAFKKSRAIPHSPQWFAARELGWKAKLPKDLPAAKIRPVYAAAFNQLTAEEKAKYVDMAKLPVSKRRTALPHVKKYAAFVKQVSVKATPEQIAEYGGLLKLAGTLWQKQKVLTQKGGQ